MAKAPKIIFLGTSVFGQIVLRNLIEEGVKPAAVVTQPDRPIDNQKTPSPVSAEAKKHKIPVISPKPQKGIAQIMPKIKNLKPDLLIVASFGMEIPPQVLEIPAKGALKLHPSLLPRHRGPSPIPTAILKGDEQTGVTVILMDRETDHGPILYQESIPVTSADTTISLTAKLSTLGGRVLAKTINKYLKEELALRPQNHPTATYSQPVKYEDGKVNWGYSNETIDRMVRAYQPWPGVWTTLGELGEELERELKDPKEAEKIVKLLSVHQDNGALVVDTIQFSTQKPLTLQEFIEKYLA
ncbi:MAG: methionyl-tRNA formyltransferase [Patescibacteria group bacterium]